MLYNFSYVLYVFIYHVFSYRKKVVRENLRNSFPGKNPDTLLVIEKKYYRHLCDVIVESVKALTISKRSIAQRSCFAPGSMEIFNRLFGEGKNCIALMGHYGNWEWAGLSMSSQSPYLLQVIYRPLRDKNFNRMMNALRSRFDAVPVAMENVAREMMKQKSTPACTVFIADQTPPPETALWLNFLNQQTPFFQGAEKLARKLHLPVVYATLKRQQRGRYEIQIEVITENCSAQPEGYLTEEFVKLLQRDIENEPSQWLWSHRRWKHKRA